VRYLDYLGKHACIHCLYKIFRKRVRRLISDFKLIDGEKRIGIIFDRSPTSFISIHFLREIYPEIEFSVIPKHTLGKIPQKVEKIVDPKCLEDFGEFFMERLLNGKFQFLEVREGMVIRPFIGVPEEEIRILLRKRYKCRGKWREVERKYSKFLREVQKVRAGSLFSLLKLYRKLKLIKA